MLVPSAYFPNTFTPQRKEIEKLSDDTHSLAYYYELPSMLATVVSKGDGEAFYTMEIEQEDSMRGFNYLRHPFRNGEPSFVDKVISFTTTGTLCLEIKGTVPFAGHGPQD